MHEVTRVGAEMQTKPTSPEARAAELAARQGGVVAGWQLLDLGFGRGAIKHRHATKRLHPLYRGVYAWGHGHVDGRGRWMGAALACGNGAVLSHRSAAALWGIRRTAAASIDVTVPASNRGRRKGIRVHVTRQLSTQDVARRDGIPVTSVTRTLLDLAAILSPTQLRRAFEEADRLELLDAKGLQRACDRSRGRRGVRRLRALLAEHRGPPPPTRSDLERDFLDLCRQAELPTPTVNGWLAGFEVDALWSDRRLVVELDSYSFHRTRASFDRDRAKDAALQLAGYRVVRVTDRQLNSQPDQVAARVRALLDPRSGVPGPNRVELS